MWNVNVVRARHGINPVTSQTVNEGFLEIEIDDYSIVDLAFSPDGSTVALACSDGGIRFFQVCRIVDMATIAVRCVNVVILKSKMIVICF